MTAITTRRSGRKLGIEPQGIDLLPIASRPYTETEEQEISAFFQKQRAENAQNPAVVALLKEVARRRQGNR